MMKTSVKLVLIISITLNIIFLLKLGWDKFNSPTYRLGELRTDISLRLFNQHDTLIFKLPRGLTVRDVSERGIGAIGQFENNRFQIVVTSENGLVDYSKSKKDLMPFGEFYSADTQN